MRRDYKYRYNCLKILKRLIIDLMLDQIELQKIILSKLTEIQNKNPNYSMRAFSKKIGISPSALSEFLKGQRRISYKKAQTICNNLNLSEPQKSTLLSFFDSPSQFPSTSYKVCADISGEYAVFIGETLNVFKVIHSGFLSLVIHRTINDKTYTTTYTLDGILRPLKPFEDYFVIAGMYGTPNELRGQKILFKKPDNAFYTVNATFRLDKNKNLLMAQKSFTPDGALFKSHTVQMTNIQNQQTPLKYDSETRMVP